MATIFTYEKRSEVNFNVKVSATRKTNFLKLKSNVQIKIANLFYKTEAWEKIRKTSEQS